jgi:predicted GIY-YIG superfamily endonuclease
MVLSGGEAGVERPSVSAWFYILRLQSGSLYAGATRDLEHRWEEHRAGTACRTTRIDPPIELAYYEELPSFSAARRRESQVKGWTRAKKETLARGGIDSLRDLSKRQET